MQTVYEMDYIHLNMLISKGLSNCPSCGFEINIGDIVFSKLMGGKHRRIIRHIHCAITKNMITTGEVKQFGY